MYTPLLCALSCRVQAKEEGDDRTWIIPDTDYDKEIDVDKIDLAALQWNIAEVLPDIPHM